MLDLPNSEWAINTICNISDELLGFLHSISVEILFLISCHHDLSCEHLVSFQLQKWKLTRLKIIKIIRE